MASEIKVDTISEKTSAGGVTIDGLLIKDGGISGDVSLIGTTPTFTIGDAGAEDAALVFDGNAQDFYIALDDSADDLLIGLGSAVGTTPAVSIDENLQVKIVATTASTSATTGSFIAAGGAGVAADLHVGDDVTLISDSAVLGFGADKDTTLTHTDGTGLTLNSTNKICFNDASQFIQGSSNAILSLGATDEIDLTATAVDLNGTLDVSGNSQFSGTITVGVDDTGKDVKFFGATSGKYLEWDESGNQLNVVGVTNLDGSIVVNESGAAAVFRVESDTITHLIYTDGGNNRLHLGTNTSDHSSNSNDDYGVSYAPGAAFQISSNGSTVFNMNRQNSDGNIINFYQEGSEEGNIAVSGSTVAYNTFCGTHWSRLADNSKPTILRGTVIESIGTMMDWYQAKFKTAEMSGDQFIKKSITLPDGKSVGDTIKYTYESVEYDAEIIKEDNERLPKCKISDTADSKAVYGVFMAWDDQDNNGDDDEVNDMYIASLGSFVVRIHKDETVAIGNWLVSNGDGTAKVLAGNTTITSDVQSSLIGKVTSTTKTHTHADDSYCVPCTLHCG